MPRNKLFYLLLFVFALSQCNDKPEKPAQNTATDKHEKAASTEDEDEEEEEEEKDTNPRRHTKAYQDSARAMEHAIKDFRKRRAFVHGRSKDDSLCFEALLARCDSRVPVSKTLIQKYTNILPQLPPRNDYYFLGGMYSKFWIPLNNRYGYITLRAISNNHAYYAVLMVCDNEKILDTKIVKEVTSPYAAPNELLLDMWGVEGDTLLLEYAYPTESKMELAPRTRIKSEYWVVDSLGKFRWVKSEPWRNKYQVKK